MLRLREVFFEVTELFTKTALSIRLEGGFFCDIWTNVSEARHHEWESHQHCWYGLLSGIVRRK